MPKPVWINGVGFIISALILLNAYRGRPLDTVPENQPINT
jgi:hypothetical protein